MNDTTIRPPRLSEIAAALNGAPPRLSELASLASGEEHYLWFCAMLDAILPHQKAWILSAGNRQQVLQHFRQAFEARYFPLLDEFIDYAEAFTDGYEDTTPWEFLHHAVPLQLHGFRIEDAHEFAEVIANRGLPPGICLMTLLFPIGEFTWEDDPNIKVSWLQAASETVPDATLRKIPADGFDPKETATTLREHGLTDIANLADWIRSATPYPLLNFQYHPEEQCEPDLPWDPDVIAEIAQQWHEAVPLLESINRGIAQIDANPRQQFDHIVDLLSENRYWWAMTRNE